MRLSLGNHSRFSFGAINQADGIIPPPVGFNGVLNQISAVASSAYGFRKLKNEYAGNAVRVRRSSDNTEQDIGFLSNGDFDSAALISFVGNLSTSNGFITKFYDHVGNRDFSQTNPGSQIRIITNGVLQLMSGKTSLNLQMANFLTAANHNWGNQMTINAVGICGSAAGFRRLLTYGTDNILFFGAGNGNFATFCGNSGGWNDVSVNTPAIDVVATPKIFTAFRSGAVLTPKVNNAVQNNKNAGAFTTTTTLSINGFSTQSWDGFLSELIIFESILSASDESILKNNQAAFYGVTL